MKKNLLLFFSFYFYFSQKFSLELIRKPSKKKFLEINNDNKTESFISKGADIDIENYGDTCVIFASVEGDQEHCWCPRGYIMCNEEDVEGVKKKINKIKNKNERKNSTPVWLKRLCDNSKGMGFKNMSIVIDYELAVICKEDSNKENADFDIIGASGYIEKEEVIQKEKENPIYVPRKCTVNNFYLCRKVKDDNVNCEYTSWSNWSICIDKKQSRSRKIVRSNQNNDNFCLWNNKIIPWNIIEETRFCEEKK